MIAKNVKLILLREIRDQLRDRRTLFMIFVLPVLLYPLLGMSMFQMAQFLREHPVRVQILGAEHLPSAPALLDDGQFAEQWFSGIEKAELLEVTLGIEPAAEPVADYARRLVNEGEFEAVVVVPEDFGARLDTFRTQLATAAKSAERERSASPKVPSPEIIYTTAKEKSQLAFIRVTRVLDHWTDQIGRENLETTQVPADTVRPFAVAEHDIAEEEQRKAAMWSKILPFMLLIWALTGAFYPAVDLCAGEKERGTLETLLSSPAGRGEIVLGKLLTVMLFSIATAVLNIASMGLTGLMISSQLPDLGPPPLSAPLWLFVALMPIAALFSALCLALAAFARSTKEGQYYLMPLVLLTLPLVILPMAPGVELNLGNALIPVSGVMLLLRQMLEGNYLAALPYVVPVTIVTLICCALSIRWAVDQFSSENVLFRETERLDVGLWVRHLLRDCEATPTFAAAIFCGVLILMLRFFMSFAMPASQTFVDLAVSTLVLQIAVVATPALLMTIMLTRSPIQTLQLRLPPWSACPAAALLAVALHPAVQWLSVQVGKLYPIDSRITEQFAHLIQEAPSLPLLIGCFALAPALFEELAFRGFILSGLRRARHRSTAIVVSAILFGVAHPVLQQSIMATFTGMVIAVVAMQTGSILPGMVYHAVHNSIPLLLAQVTPETLERMPWLGALGTIHESGGIEMSWQTTVLGTLLSALLVAWFWQMPRRAGDASNPVGAIHPIVREPAAI